MMRILNPVLLAVFFVMIAFIGCKEEPNRFAVKGVVISPKTLRLKVGETATLTTALMPATAQNKQVRWHSSKASVAQVSSSGKILATGPGQTIITVITQEGDKTATCTLTVILPVQSVALDRTALDLVVHAKATLKPIFTPAQASNKKVTWQSSDIKIATVSATGEVTGAGDGTATITATTEDGDKTATAQVKVVAWGMVLAGGSALPSKFELARYGAVALKIGGSSPPATVSWTSSNNAVATVSPAQGLKVLVSGVTAGEVFITATAPGNQPRTAKIKVVYENYRGDFTGKQTGPYYYISSLQTEGGTANISYTYTDPVSPAKPARYVYDPRTATSGGLTISKRTGKFTIKIDPKYDDSIMGLWIDWNIDGYFSGNSEKPDKKAGEFYYVGTPKKNSMGVVSNVITIPAHARIGKLRMRVQNNWLGSDKYAPQFFANLGNNWIDNSSVRDFGVEIVE